jgi:hypothetical protein
MTMIIIIVIIINREWLLNSIFQCLENLTVVQLVTQSRAFLWHLDVHYCVAKAYRWSLSRTSRTQSTSAVLGFTLILYYHIPQEVSFLQLLSSKSSVSLYVRLFAVLRNAALFCFILRGSDVHFTLFFSVAPGKSQIRPIPFPSTSFPDHHPSVRRHVICATGSVRK